MINLETDSRLAKWFVWCCDNLPLTVTRDHSDESKEPDGVRRKGAYYLERGTTLCHIFWATLWVPLAVLAVAGLTVFMFGFMHFQTYHDFNDKIGPVAFFMPEMFALAGAAIFGTILLVLIGGSKSGFFKLLWQYLKGAKSRICPLVRFDDAHLTPAE